MAHGKQHYFQHATLPIIRIITISWLYVRSISRRFMKLVIPAIRPTRDVRISCALAIRKITCHPFPIRAKTTDMNRRFHTRHTFTRVPTHRRRREHNTRVCNAMYVIATVFIYVMSNKTTRERVRDRIDICGRVWWNAPANVCVC